MTALAERTQKNTFRPELTFDDMADTAEEMVSSAVSEVDEVTEDEEAPVDAAATFSLRNYQKAAVDSVFREFKNGSKSTLIVSATGTGKAVLAAEMVRRNDSWGHATLVIVHREELINQLVRSIGRMGFHALKEKAEHRAIYDFGTLSNVVVASVQTMRGKRLEEWKKDAFSMIITDEAHRSISPTYRDVYSHFNKARLVGMTGTDDRLDGQNIGTVYETLAFEYNIRDAIRDEWLVPLEAFPIETDPVIDLRGLRISSSGDFSDGDADKMVQDNIGVMVNAIVKENALEDRRTVAMTPLVESAKALSFALNDVGISADWVAGCRGDRAEVQRRHQNGEFQVLCFCDLLVEGYDDPQISCVVVARPTKSRRIYSQFVGRGTRRWPEHLPPTHPDALKRNCRIVDFAMLTGKHSLVSPVDLYDNANTPDEVVKRAKELIEEGKEKDIDIALEVSLAEFEIAERIRVKKRVVQSRSMKFDPIGVCEILGVNHKEGSIGWDNGKVASPNMVSALQRFGVECDASIGFGEAKKLLDTCFTRSKFGKATMKQVALMMRLGMDAGPARNMSFEGASEWISAKFKK